MIKELIKDLIYDKITLNQGLTRAKLIASMIKDVDFSNWLRSELNGYKSDEDLPEYRYISCGLKGTINEFGNLRVVPIDLSELDKRMGGKIYRYNLIHDIDTLETTIKEAGSDEIIFKLSPYLVNQISEMTLTRLIDAGREVQKNQLQYIINQTKQRLIDTLVQLNDEFPNIESDFEPTTENKEKIQNIINNHIYGDNVNTNIGIGDTVTQIIESKNISKIINELREIGLNDQLLEELQNLSSEKKNEKDNIISKFTAWISKMSQFVIEKGIEHQIPVIIERASELIK